MMRVQILVLFALLSVCTALAQTQVFDDEFDTTALDSNVWVVINRPGDASNSELECYTPANTSLAGGFLLQTAKVDSSCSGYNYTSSMVQWKSFNFTYGTVEVRAKLTGGKGPWPAIWLLGSNCQTTNVTTPNNVPPCDWPNTGSDEIDFVEIVGSNLTRVNQQIHSNGYNPGCTATTTDVSQNWHIYQLVWAAGSVAWKIDGTTTCTITQHVPTTPMFLIMNVAVGGAGGSVDNSTLPQTSSIDYVRVTQAKPNPPTGLKATVF